MVGGRGPFGPKGGPRGAPPPGIALELLKYQTKRAQNMLRDPLASAAS